MVTFAMVFHSLPYESMRVVRYREKLEPYIYSAKTVTEQTLPDPENATGVLYVTPPRYFHRLLDRGAADIILVCGAEEPPEDFYTDADEVNVGVVRLGPDMSPEEVRRSAADELERLKSWVIRLFGSITETSELQSTVELAYSVIRNPIMLSDAYMNRLAFTRDAESVEAWGVLKRAGDIPSSDMARLDLLSFVNRADTVIRKETYHIQSKRKFLYEVKNGFARLSSLVAVNYRTVGHVLMVCTRGREFERVDRDLFNILDTVCRLALRYYETDRSGGGIVWEYFILNLLQGNYLTLESVNSVMSRLSWNPEKNFFVLAAPVTGGEDTKKLYSVRDMISDALPGVTSLIYQGSVVMLVDTKNDAALTEVQRRTLGQIFTQSGLVCGVSQRYTNLMDTSSAFGQALYAAKASPAGGDPFRYYGDFILEHVFDEMLKERDAASLIHPSLLKLREVDAERGSELFRTLAAYLKNRRNQLVTARQLNIQRSSLIYRLNKIEALTGLDMDNAETTLHLLISLRLLEKQIQAE